MTRIFLLSIVVLCLLVCIPPASATTNCSFCGWLNLTQGLPGAANMTMNLTANMTANMTAGPAGAANMTMNLTANMTAGPEGLMNLTANMTAGPAGSMNLTPNQTAGAPGPDNDAWYLWVNGSRVMTGMFNAGGFNLSDLLNPVADQDAVTLNYLNAFPIINSSYATTANLSSTNISASTNASAYTLAVAATINSNLTGYITSVNSSVNTNLTAYITAVNATGGPVINNTYVTLDNSTYSGQFATAANLSSTNVSASANASAYSVAINTSMKAYVDAKPVGGDMSWNASYLLRDGTRAMTGALNMSGLNITGIGKIFADNDVVNLSYLVAVNNSASANASAYSLAVGNAVRTNDTAYSTAINASVNTNLTAYITAVNATVGINNSYVTLSNGSYVQITNGSYVLITNTSYAKLVGGYVPTANLGSGAASSSTYLRGDQTWDTPAGGSDPTASSTTLIYSDFYDPGVTTALPGLTGLAISTGTSAVVATTANHPGVIYMRDSTTANGGYKYGCVGTQLIGGGETFEVVFQPVGVRTGQTAKMGWSDTAAARTLPADGIYFNISGTGAAISLRENVSSNSVHNGTNTAYAPTTATWYRGTIAVNSAGTKVTFTLYNEAGASVWTNTVESPIPTGAGRDTSPCIIVGEETTDAAADIVRLDYVKWGSTKTLVR